MSRRWIMSLMNRIRFTFHDARYSILCRKGGDWNRAVTRVQTDEMFFRTGDHISEYILTVLLSIASGSNEHDNKMEALFSNFMRKVIEESEGKWIAKFIGHEKSIEFGITPWETSPKPFYDYHLSRKYIIDYIERLLWINERLRKNGYRPDAYGYISGVLLKNSHEEERFVVYQGNRRAAVLFHLGVKEVDVALGGILGDRDYIIRDDEVEHWENVKNGLFEKDEALKFFHYFFDKVKSEGRITS